ncbi:MAG: acylphosphatase [Archaeoglobaceae archaeon]
MALKIIIKGKVHGVGYRVKLINMALEYGIDRFAVFNTFTNGKEAVMILVDAPEEILELLKERIKAEKPEKAIVESVEFLECRFSVPPIERSMQAFQIEHWGKAIPIMLNMLEKQDLMLEKQDKMLEKQDLMLEKMDLMLEKQDLMLEKQDKMLEKQDLMLEKQDKMLEKQDLMLEKQDKMLEKQDLVINKLDETKQELGSKIDQTREDLAERLDETNAKLELLRSDLRDYLEKNMKELNARILRIEEALRKAGLM